MNVGGFEDITPAIMEPFYGTFHQFDGGLLKQAFDQELVDQKIRMRVTPAGLQRKAPVFLS